jgi:Concanavalin A-like lectin/glucanases superfamily
MAELIAHWKMDEGNGQVTEDASGHGCQARLGALAIIESTDPEWVGGRKAFTAALAFDGDDFVEVQNSSVLEPAAITVEAWARACRLSPHGYLISKGAQEGASSYCLTSGESSGLTFRVFDGQKVYSSADAGPELWDGRWHHLAGSYDGQTVRLYVDGEEIGAGIPAAASIRYGLETHNTLYIGAFQGESAHGFVGAIDEIRIWDGALSAIQIRRRAKE